jgi:hypothetical protein
MNIKSKDEEPGNCPFRVLEQCWYEIVVLHLVRKLEVSFFSSEYGEQEFPFNSECAMVKRLRLYGRKSVFIYFERGETLAVHEV